MPDERVARSGTGHPSGATAKGGAPNISGATANGGAPNISGATANGGAPDISAAAPGRPDPRDRLLERVARGDREAAEPLCRSLYPAIVAFCTHRLRDSALAHDAAQAVLCTMLKEAPVYDGSRPALPWVLTLAHFECLSERRRQHRRREVLLGDESDDPPETCAQPDPLTQVLEQERAELFQRALEGLASDDQRVMERFLRDESSSPPNGALSSRERKQRQRTLERFRTLFWRLYDG